MGWMRDESGLQKRRANHAPLTPLSHLARAVKLFPEREAVVYGSTRHTYAQYHARVSRLASALEARGIRPGEVVSSLLLNTLPHVEAHFGVPACGAVLNAINVRLDVGTVAYIFEHAETRLILCDTAFVPLAEEALGVMEGERPVLIEVPDAEAGLEATGRHTTYEELLAEGREDYPWIMPEDEWESLTLNYTSGTTGRPKGVVYHHRGAYLSTLGQVISWRMVMEPRYLVIVPLFHCNNWCHTWMIPALGGTIVCCRDVTAKNIYNAIADEGVTHFGGAPIVLGLLVNAPEAERRAFDHTVEVFTAGAPPPAAILAAVEPLGFNVTQVYGLTETYGPITECLWDGGKWDGLEQKDRAAIKARTGVAMPTAEEVTVMDEFISQTPMDAETPGEIVMRGNMVMKGYYKNPEASEEAFRGGYFHSEDIAIQHPDGYIQITDRAKDIIISGGENVSSVEVEGVLMHHPAVNLCAVVAKPDEKWGEVPCAYVELKPGAEVTEEDLISHCRESLAGFKTPKYVVFHELPKTPTGKIQKFELRRHAKEWSAG
ncbi:AMP-binding protein [Vannielia litorea]|uniref:AMP-binding protein n=1 Tax=Vannielia litorea TaxID=1217970 RepID=UPI001C98D67C|nr:AMP-binding protein [Vannielia litorea]MBY6155325.1 AMP-binding protein [Vannielia litorea]